MQYVGQTGLSLKTRFHELFPNIKKPKTSDTFLYRHFKSNGHLPSKIVIQAVEKIITNISKKPDFDCVFFSFVKVDLMVNVKMTPLSAKFVLKNV